MPVLPEDSKLAFGYIKDDDAARSNLFSYLEDLISATNKLCGRNLIIEFPNLIYSKVDILRNIIHNYPEVFDYCVSCECTTDDCNLCMPGHHLFAALVTLLLNKDEKVSEFAREQLNKRFNYKFPKNYLQSFYELSQTEGEVLI